MIIEGIKKLSDDKNSPEMNDSEVDPVVPKNRMKNIIFSLRNLNFKIAKMLLFSKFVPKSMDCGSKPHSQAHLPICPTILLPHILDQKFPAKMFRQLFRTFFCGKNRKRKV